MKATEKNQATISPATYVILGIGLIAIIWLLWPTSQKTPQQQPAQEIVHNQTGTEVPKTQVKAGEQEVETEDTVIESSARNPFLPPSIVRTMSRKTLYDSTRNVTPPIVQEQSRRGLDVISSGDKTDKDEIKSEEILKPVWKGFLQVPGDQLVIIRYKQKSHFLRLGDRLSGTEYRLTDINPQYVVLLSPTDTLKLEKVKKGVK